MSASSRPIEVGDRDPVIFPAGIVDMLDDRFPDDALGRVVRLCRTHRGHPVPRVLVDRLAWLRPTMITVGVPWPGM